MTLYSSTAYDYSGYENDGTNLEDLGNDSSFPWNVVHVTVLVVNVMIFVLGICGNGVVIWLASLKMKKSVNIAWYLSLAVSDFVFCATLPVGVVYMASKNWVFGVFMCKFTSFVMFLNMFSSIFLLVIISVDRCVSVMFPVWAQNHRTVKKAFIVVVFTWAVSIVFSFPSMIFRDTKKEWNETICFNNYDSTHIHGTIVISRFVCGFVAPFLIIFSCYVIIFWKLKNNRMNKSSKPFKVMSALIAAFLVCWLPYHIVVLLEATNGHDTMLHELTKVFTTLASANSLLNPFLYAFMGEDFKKKCFKSFLSKIENAISEEMRTTNKWISASSSVDGRVSTSRC